MGTQVISYMKQNNKKLEDVNKLATALGVITKTTKLAFGKYKNKKVSTVLAEDPKYLIWISENTNHVIDKKVLAEATGQQPAIDVELDQFDCFDEIESTF